MYAWNFLGKKLQSKHNEKRMVTNLKDFKACKDRFEAQKKSKKGQNYEHN